MALALVCRNKSAVTLAVPQTVGVFSSSNMKLSEAGSRGVNSWRLWLAVGANAMLDPGVDFRVVGGYKPCA